MRFPIFVFLSAQFALFPARVLADPVVHVLPVNDLCDGVEYADSLWYREGVPGYYGNLSAGYDVNGSVMEPAFVFSLPGFYHGDTVAHAHLRLACLGGELQDTLRLQIRGLYRFNTAPFDSGHLPSRYQVTAACVTWTITRPWQYGGYWDPLYTDSPEISPILNELLASDSWPVPGLPGGGISLSIQLDGPAPDFQQDCRFADSGTPWHPAELVIYRRLEDAFLAPPLVGRVSDRSAEVSFCQYRCVDCYLGYGLEPGVYIWAQGADRTPLPDIAPLEALPAETAQSIGLAELTPDTRYFYRVFVRAAGTEEWSCTDEMSFRTQRAPGSQFSFSILSDSHLEDYNDGQEPNEYGGSEPRQHGDSGEGTRDAAQDIELYRTTLRNVARDSTDFLVNLGDYAMMLRGGSLSLRTPEEARRIYTDERRIMGEAGCALPFYLTLGNHEGELGWLDDGSSDGPFTWSGVARKEFTLNPDPDDFYSGNEQQDPRIGFPEDYYAWEWGDALFVVLDPFRPTLNKPHHYGGGGSGDGWDWTLGREQYDWLARVLSASQKTWKFVFIHHLAGGVMENMWGPYGRGGTEAVRYSLAGYPTFEWGGEDGTGAYVFDEHRPDWAFGSIHRLLVDNRVTAVFHGHDHCYWRQELDGIVYQECPQPSSHGYSVGLCDLGLYEQGDYHPNSGRLRVTVSPERVRVEYLRSFLPGEGENDMLEASYDIEGPASAAPERAARLGGPRIRLAPMPCRGSLKIQCSNPWPGTADLSLYNPHGRLVARMANQPSSPTGVIRWNLASGRPLPSGVYELLWTRGSERERHKILIIR